MVRVLEKSELIESRNEGLVGVLGDMSNGLRKSELVEGCYSCDCVNCYTTQCYSCACYSPE